MKRTIVGAVAASLLMLSACSDGSEEETVAVQEVEGLFSTFWADNNDGRAIMRVNITNHRPTSVELVDMVLDTNTAGDPGIAVDRAGSVSATIEAPPNDWDPLPLNLEPGATAAVLVEVVLIDCNAVGEWEQVDGKASFTSLNTPPLTMVLGDGTEVLSAAFPPTEALTDELDVAFCGN